MHSYIHSEGNAEGEAEGNSYCPRLPGPLVPALDAATQLQAVVWQPFRAHDEDFFTSALCASLEGVTRQRREAGSRRWLLRLQTCAHLRPLLFLCLLWGNGRLLLRVTTCYTNIVPRVRLDLPNGPKLRRRGVLLVRRTAGGTSPCCVTRPPPSLRVADYPWIMDGILLGLVTSMSMCRGGG